MRTSSDVVHTIEGTKLGETAKAIKFRVELISGEPVEVKTEWFPISQTRKIITAAPNSGELDQLVVSEWILKTKGLIV